MLITSYRCRLYDSMYKQINTNMTPEFERDLRRYMRSTKPDTKSDAIRQALREAVAHDLRGGD